MILEQIKTQQVLLSLYLVLWSYCAGWNRVSFGQRQVRYIVRSLDIEVCLYPLEKLRAFSTTFRNKQYIVLNQSLVPDEIDNLDDLIKWLFRPGGAHEMKFVFFHEIGHVLLHTDHRKAIRLNQVKEAKFLERLTEKQEHRIKNYQEIAKEVEADFFALLALVPDRVLERQFRQLRNHTPGHRRFLLMKVAYKLLSGKEYSRKTESVADHDFMARLATYRVKLFEEFCRDFYQASNLIANKDPSVVDACLETYRKPQSIGSKLDHRLTKSKSAKLDGDVNALQFIYEKHPLVRNSETLEEMLEEQYPFEQFLTQTVAKSKVVTLFN